MARAAKVLSLRTLGLTLAQIASVLEAERQELQPALARHQAKLEEEIRRLAATVQKVSALRSHVMAGGILEPLVPSRLSRPVSRILVSLELRWPWDGEVFELRDIKPLTYIIGPLGSGKTRLAKAIADKLPGTVFIGLDRAADHAAEAEQRLAADPALQFKVDKARDWLLEHGAQPSHALTALLVALEDDKPAALVVDIIEQGLEEASQEALAAYFRRQKDYRRPIFMLTRSSSILDLRSLEADDAIILCPANHSAPTWIAPYPGSPGHETVASCLAKPCVRARTEGVVASRMLVA
jgi:hypothetical protein